MKRLEKYGERNYAAKEGKLEKSDLRKHKDRDARRKAAEAVNSDSDVKSGQVQEEVKFLILKQESHILKDDSVVHLISTKEKEMAKAKLGSGARFKAVEKKAAASGAENPAAVAAAAGMKKYGKAKMEKLATAGKKMKKK